MQIKSDSPIYIQIATDIKEKILNDKYAAGCKLPSVRDLSVVYEVTTLTVQRAMQQLEIEGMIQSKKGIGSFVTMGCRDRLEQEMIYEQAKDFVRKMKNRGLDNKKIESLILEVLKNGEQN